MGRIDSDLKRITSEPWLVWQCWWATFSARAKWRSFMSAGSSVEKKYLTGSGVVREAMFQQLSWYKRFLGRSNERPPRASSSHLGSVIFEGWHAVREEERLKRLADWPFVVNTSWKVLFGCGTGLLILIEGSGIYDLLFKSGGTRGMKTIENMIF